MLAAIVAAAQCQARSVGPGSLNRGGTTGATCLVRAYDDGCRPAAYTLSMFGVDTIRSETFRTQATSGGCQIAVTASFRVVPQAPHTTGRSICLRVRKLVLDRCTPAATIPLTKF
ncbi:MAG TPA: hypothetical protein VKR23_09415 [Gaiellaceae bacterium]|nr:hypothetical protein [Gaiellaceae bacterium]